MRKEIKISLSYNISAHSYILYSPFYIIDVIIIFVLEIKGGDFFWMKLILTVKCGTITVSVYKDNLNRPFFKVQSDSEDVLPVSYVIEDTLFLY